MSEQTPPICDYEGSDYQQSFWDFGGRAYEDAVEALALRRLLPAGGDFMLELGAGAGRNTRRYLHYQRVALVDYSRTQLLQAQAHLGNRIVTSLLQRMYTACPLWMDGLMAPR